MVATGERGWLRAPTRVAGVGRTNARLLLLAIAVVMVVVVSLAGPALTLSDQDHVAIVAAMRDGSSFYGLIGGIVPAGAFGGRLVPLPTLALVESRVGSLGMTILLCGVLASILLTGWDRLAALFDKLAARATVALLLLGGAAAGAMLTIEEPHAGWIALLGAWSLLLRRGDRWTEAAAIAAIAATIDPAALVLTITMAAVAIRERCLPEGWGWLGASMLGAVTWAVHRLTLAKLGVAAVGTGIAASPIDVAVAALPPVAPVWLATAIWVTMIAGWFVVRDPLAMRITSVTIIGVLVALLPGMQVAATLTIVLLPLAAIFAAVAAATLVRQATSRRRITVTRVAR